MLFDASKEHMLIMSTANPEGESIRLLGVDFDGKLCMNEAVGVCVDEASWRLRTLLRTRRFHTDAELLHFFFVLFVQTAINQTLSTTMSKAKYYV